MQNVCQIVGRTQLAFGGLKYMLNNLSRTIFSLNYEFCIAFLKPPCRTCQIVKKTLVLNSSPKVDFFV